MKSVDILVKGNEIIKKDIAQFKDYYLRYQDFMQNEQDLDSSIEFELQYLKYLMDVEDNYQEAILQANKLKTFPNISLFSLSKIYRTNGKAYYHLGEYKQSMEAYIESVNLLNKIKDRNFEQNHELAVTYLNISLLYEDQKEDTYNSSKKLEFLQMAEKIFIEINSTKGLGLLYSGLANYYTFNKKIGLALRYQFKSIEYKKRENDQVGLAISYGNLSSIYLEFNKLDKAEFYLLLSKELKEKEISNYSKCILYIQLGKLYIAKKEFSKAIVHLEIALNIAEKHALIKEEEMILTEQAIAYENMNDFANAYKVINRKIKVQEQLFDINKNKAILELKFKFETDKQRDEAILLQKKNAEIQEYLSKLKNTNFELNQFAQIASHDLKEPARLIKMHISKLEKSMSNIDESQEYLINFIKKTSDNLYHLVNELQNYTNIDHQLKVVENIRIRDEFTNIKNNVSKSLKYNQIHVDFTDLPETLTFNRSQFNQLFFQLIENAFLFNDKEHKKVEVSYESSDSHHIFLVKDNGIGIKNVYYSKIFEMFERLHDNSTYQGTGIGLAIARKIITEMNGFIEIESQLGIGSVFKVYILK